jgi:ParB family chromosome partitioning protein
VGQEADPRRHALSLGRHELIGARRLMAAKQAGLETIPALVLEEALKPEEALEARLIENLQREDLDPLDEAEAYMALREMGYSLTAVGRRLGKSRPYVSQRVKLLRLHPELREAVRHRTLTPDHAHALMRLKNTEQQLTLAQEAQAKGLSVHETRQRVRELLGKEFKWRLVPVRISPETYEALQKIAPEGNVKRLIQETIQKLVQA